MTLYKPPQKFQQRMTTATNSVSPFGPATYLTRKNPAPTNEAPWAPIILKRGQELPKETPRSPAVKSPALLGMQRQDVFPNFEDLLPPNLSRTTRRGNRKTEKNQILNPVTPKGSNGQKRDAHAQWRQEESNRIRADFCTDLKAAVLRKRQTLMNKTWRNPQIPAQWIKWNVEHMAMAGIPKNLQKFSLKVLRKWEFPDARQERVDWEDMGPGQQETVAETAYWISCEMDRSKDFGLFAELFRWLYNADIAEAMKHHPFWEQQQQQPWVEIGETVKEVPWGDRPPYMEEQKAWEKRIQRWADMVEMSDEVNWPAGFLEDTIARLKDLEMGDSVDDGVGEEARRWRKRRADEDALLAIAEDPEIRRSFLFQTTLERFERERSEDKKIQALLRRQRREGIAKPPVLKRCGKCGDYIEEGHTEEKCDRIFCHNGEWYKISGW